MTLRGSARRADTVNRPLSSVVWDLRRPIVAAGEQGGLQKETAYRQERQGYTYVRLTYASRAVGGGVAEVSCCDMIWRWSPG